MCIWAGRLALPAFTVPSQCSMRLSLSLSLSLSPLFFLSSLLLSLFNVLRLNACLPILLLLCVNVSIPPGSLERAAG
ncbi:uncharacterized protein LY79DRAFT_170730 [Colletotrichum navitas]|uniref:Uncharacterized protein n=1 Tax=Colletotrichum navitas TaxID=681940 RepID=A0AAD8Q2S2_9PEZI|nr:uncharacterized protein LY79DRAFT_170730 [Colletotrichum navitas]KAK1593759.1 hypothetical protein LY79DRAFT_170730 [Colletotrichum navitas]